MESSPNWNVDNEELETSKRRKIQRVMRFFTGDEVPLYMSNHYNPEHFKEPEPGHQPELPFDEYEQALLDYERVFDS